MFNFSARESEDLVAMGTNWCGTTPAFPQPRGYINNQPDSLYNSVAAENAQSSSEQLLLSCTSVGNACSAAVAPVMLSQKNCPRIGVMAPRHTSRDNGQSPRYVAIQSHANDSAPHFLNLSQQSRHRKIF